MKAICVGVVHPAKDLLKTQDTLRELEELGKTAGYVILDSLIISVGRIFAATFMSRDMAKEVEMEILEKEADTVLFNEDLTPAQLRNLETLWNVIIIDRTELILKIFQIHARTHEAKLQVEIAQLRYFLPRLKRMWTHLSRIEGGYGFTKGPGETQIETDRRIIKDRISLLSRKLKKIRVRREVRRKKRLESGLAMVSLVGYTNVGKTSLLNALVKETLPVDDQLFTTLSPVVRKAHLGNHLFALISDTVGFIRQLPTHLVASFHSTIQEIEYSDILVLIQDITHHSREKQLETVKSVLGEIGVLDKPQIQVFSKIDLLSEEEKEHYRNYYPEAVFLSLVTGKGIDILKERIIDIGRKQIRNFAPSF